MKVASAAVTNPNLSEKSYREALTNSEETLGVANPTRFEVYYTTGKVVAHGNLV